MQTRSVPPRGVTGAALLLTIVLGGVIALAAVAGTAALIALPAVIFAVAKLMTVMTGADHHSQEQGADEED